MTDPAPVKNPERVPMSLQEQGDNVGTETGRGAGVQIVPVDLTPSPSSGAAIMSFKINSDTGAYTVQVDGVYQNPETGDRFQYRKGQVVPENVAKTFKRVGGWPGEVDENAVEAADTTAAKAAAAPANKANPEPSNKAS